MNAIDIRTARQVMAGLVTAGAVMAAIGGTSLEQQVATVLPPVGAALVAAGMLALLHAESLTGRQAVILGAVLVAAGVGVAVIGSSATEAAVTATLVPLGGAFVAVGTFATVSGATAVSSKAGLRPS